MILVCILLLLAFMFKSAGKVVSVIVSIFLAVEYLSRTSETPHLAWHSLIMFLLVIFIVYSLLDDERKKH